MDDEMLEDTSENMTESEVEAEEISEFERLKLEIEENPGSASFPRLAEAYRRAGQVERAETIAKGGLAEAPERMGGRVALALAMLDKGEIAQASQELASILENVPEVPSDPTEAALGVSAETETDVVHESDEDRASEEPEDLDSSDGSDNERNLAKQDLEVEEEVEETVVEEEVAEEALVDGEASDEEVDEPKGHTAQVSEDQINSAREAAPESEPTSLEHRLYSTPLASPSEALPHFDETRANDPTEDELRQDEIDNAFDSAQADADQMISANRLAESAMLDVLDIDPEADAVDAAERMDTEDTEAPDNTDELNEAYSAADRRVFATKTMAGLLEGQGDLAGAERVRASIPDEHGAVELEIEGQAATTPVPLEPASPPVALVPDPEPDSSELDLDADLRSELHLDLDTARAERATRIIKRLESWLANIRRDVA